MLFHTISRTCSAMPLSICGVSSFFFQAEDGIRDGHVTGVQTCALPISRRLFVEPSLFVPANKSSSVTRNLRTMKRSEERRVGKECRYWWAGGSYKTNN